MCIIIFAAINTLGIEIAVQFAKFVEYVKIIYFKVLTRLEESLSL